VEQPAPGWPLAGSFKYDAREDRWEWSDEVAVMHGYEPGTVTPTTELVLSHKHPDDKPTVAQLIEQVRRLGIPFSSRHRIIDTAGKIHVVVVVGDRWKDGAGEVVGTTGFYIDVTEEFDADVRRSLDEVVAIIVVRRATINQAIGMLMLAHGLSADERSKSWPGARRRPTSNCATSPPNSSRTWQRRHGWGPASPPASTTSCRPSTSASASPATRASRRPATPAGPGHRRRRSPGR